MLVLLLSGLWCMLDSAQAAELYYTNRTYSAVEFNIQGEPTAIILHTNAVRLTNVVRGAAITILENDTYGLEKKPVTVGYRWSAEEAWEAAVQLDGQEWHHPGSFEKVGWVRGTRFYRGEWGAYLWSLQNHLAFKPSETETWRSPTNGASVKIINVIVGSLGIYPPVTPVVDIGPDLSQATNFPGGEVDWNETKMFSADTGNVFYIIAIPDILIRPRKAVSCTGGSNIEYSVTGSNIPAGVVWELSPAGLANGAAFDYSDPWRAVVRPGNIATNYKVRATAMHNVNFYDEVDLKIVKVDIVETNVYLGLTNLVSLRLTPGSSANVQWEIIPGVQGGAFIKGASRGTSVVVNTGSLLTNYTVKAYAIGLTNCFDTCTVTVIKVGMTAYRPTTELPAYGNPFAKHEVPDDQEETPGAGIRVNGDDDNINGTPDRTDTTVSGENDLIEVELKTEPYPVSAVTYVLKRSNSNIKVWDSQNKGTALLDSGTETTVIFSATTKTVWVENPSGGGTDLELIARTGTTDVRSDKIHFYPFSNVVVLFEGEFGGPSDPPDSGISTLALAAYTNGYDVHVYDEPDLLKTPNTEDLAFYEIDSAVENRGVTAVAVIGYSHGGGSTYRISKLMDDDATAFNLAFTAYIDAITQPFGNFTAEDRRPVGSAFHVNYYQVAQANDFPLYLDGTPSIPAGAGFEDNVDHPTVTESHTTIDDAQAVQDGILTRLFQLVNR